MQTRDEGSSPQIWFRARTGLEKKGFQKSLYCSGEDNWTNSAAEQDGDIIPSSDPGDVMERRSKRDEAKQSLDLDAREQVLDLTPSSAES